MEYINPTIPESEIEENKQKYIELFKNYVVPAYKGADKLLDWICKSDFFEAPASTRYHLCCKGGLCKHSLNVYERLKKLVFFEYGNEYENALGVDLSEIVLIALCHDLCKANSYKVEMRNVKNDRGEWVKEPFYKYSPEFEMGGHGQKSLFIIQNCVQGLTLNVCSAIVYHMGASGSPNSPLKDDTAMACMEEFPIVMFTNMADTMATFIDEARAEKV